MVGSGAGGLGATGSTLGNGTGGFGVVTGRGGGEAARLRSCDLWTRAFFVVSPYLRLGKVCFGAWRRVRMSVVA